MSILYTCLFLVLLLTNAEGATRVIDFAAAKVKATAFAAQLTNAQKTTIVSGVGTGTVKNCVYTTFSVTSGSTTFPGMCLDDGPLGVRSSYGISQFPAGINAAQTWDRDLIYQRADGIGAEFRGKGINVMLGPGMNMARAPLAGRNWEGFGADPYLSGEAAFATIQGVQDNGVIANAKHFIGNEQEHFRYTSSSNIDDRTLREVYGWPFYKAVKAGAASVMCAFNLINNDYACHSPLMNSLLRNEYGFQGFVLSDYNAAKDTKLAINNGMDMTQPDAYPFGSTLTNATGNGVTQATLDNSVVRILTAWYALGQDQGYPPVTINYQNPKGAPVNNVNTSAHAALIRKIGAESSVLLKNLNNALPLSKTAGLKIGVFGTDSMMPTKIKNANDGTWTDGTVSQGYGSASVFWPYQITPLAAIKSAFGSSNVKSAPNDFDLTTAQSTASQVDVAIVCVNVNSGENYVSIDGNLGDRNNFSLWHNGDNLINAVASVKKTVVVMHTTGQVNMPWATNPNVVAILLAGLPGQETGNSLVDVLTGAVNPSGKLAYTIAKSSTDYPASVITTGTEPVPIPYNEKLLVDYRWFDKNSIQPLYEFGYGLSYTTFQYSNFVIVGPNQVAYGPANDTLKLITAQVTITNIGTVLGKEVCQFYIAYPAIANEPPRVLRGFQKVTLAAGASTTITFSLTGMEIGAYDTSAKSWQLIPGTYTAYAAASSRDLRLSTTFTITGSAAGMDIPGADLAGMPVQTSSAYACDQLCKGNAQCVGWAFAYSGASGCSVTNQCWLKSSVGTPSANSCRQYGVK